VRQQVSLQFMDGWHAQRMGLHKEANPYDKETQRHSRNEWLHGWADRHNRIAAREPFLYDEDPY